MGDIRRRGAVALGITGLVAPLTLALGTAPAQAASCTTQTGPYQKQVEKFLGRPVDGRQLDCRLQGDPGLPDQARHHPERGLRRVRHLGRDGPDEQAEGRRQQAQQGRESVNKGRIACVNLTLQLSWIQDGSRLVYGPVPVRTGRLRYEPAPV